MDPEPGVKSPRGNKGERKAIRTFTASPDEIRMLEAVAHYHGFSKSATITNLVKKEFWRVFPQGTSEIRPDPGAHIRREPLGEPGEKR
jgi:hypothetical protein